MFSRIKRLLIVCLLLAPAFVVWAGEPEQLSLEASVALALENNPDYRIAQKEVQKASAMVGEAYANILPQLDAFANFQHAWEIQENTIPNFIKEMLGPQASPDMPDFVKLSFGLENTFTYGAQVTQPLFLGWAGIAGIQTAQAAKRATEQNLERVKQDLIYQTANAFYSCLLTQELVKVQEQSLDQARANLEVVQKKYNVGMASGFDKMRAEVEYANLQPEMISARNAYQVALTGLRTVLGLEKGQTIEVIGSFVFNEDEYSQWSLLDLQNLAASNRPELQALQQQKVISEKGITIARSNFLPKLIFQTDYSFLASRNDLDIAQGDFSKGFTSAVSLQIPLFNGFRSSRQYQKARLDYKIALDSEKQVRDGIAAQVEIAYNKLLESREKYISAKETVDLASEALRLANLMYDEGANTQLDVINSQFALTRARLNYISSLYQYQVSRYELRKAAGLLKELF
jgi:outer membrane protein